MNTIAKLGLSGAGRPARGRCRASTLGLCVAALFFAGPGSTSAREASHERVLLLHSLGTHFAPFDEFASGLRAELTRRSPRPVEFFETSLETARFPQTNTEEPLAEYLSVLFQETGMDLVVTIGGPAARFSLAHRGRLFPSTPLLMAGLDQRVLGTLPRAHAAAITVELDIPATVDHVLRLLPGTTDMVVVMGGSALDAPWLDELRRAFEPFSERVRFEWLSGLSVPEMEERIADLSVNTAVLYFNVSVDGDGVPHEHDRALDRLRAVSSAPMFGLYESDVGRGVVGGPLISISEGSRRAAETALRILNGEAPEDIRGEPLTAGAPVYDYRELERWGIPQSRLPSGSRILFRPPSWWVTHKEPLLLGASVLGLETLLIVGLVVQRARRRRAEEEANALSQRLLTAHEDERGRLGRELHDDVSQRLVRLAIDAAHVEKLLHGLPDEELARSMREDASRLSEDVHALSYRLHPSVLHELGLAEALKAECELFSRREGIHAQLSVGDAPPDLEPERALCLFRIAQESLRNVARHARARRVELRLTCVDGGFQMEAKDDGIGFVPERRQNHPSLGLASMRERARLVHGTLTVVSAPGRGTTIRAWVPEKPARVDKPDVDVTTCV